MAYRKEGAEEDLTSPAAEREDKDGKSDCFQLTSGQSMWKRLLDPCVMCRTWKLGGFGSDSTRPSEAFLSPGR